MKRSAPTQFLVLSLLSLSLPRAVLAAPQPAVTTLTTNYFSVVHSRIQNATSSVHLAMYLIGVRPHDSTSSPPFVLVQDLVNAHNRGLAVNVCLDHSYRYEPETKRKTIDPKNDFAAGILAASGINVAFSPPGRTLHAKLLVLDRQTVIVGSHNWTYGALSLNTEDSVLIESPQLAREQLALFSALDAEPYSDRFTPQLTNANAIAVPLAFLTDPQLAPRMMAKRDQRAFDTYLLLLRFAAATNTVELQLPYAPLAAGLGIDNMSETAYRRQITKTLRKLQNTYHLIECQLAYGAPATVTLLPVTATSRAPQAEPQPAAPHRSQSAIFNLQSAMSPLPLPPSYWSYGHATNLSHAAKFAYLICLHQQALSPTAPWWSASRDALAEQYSANRDTIGRGTRELEKQDLLEIVRSTVPEGATHAMRRPNRYRLKPLLSPAQLSAQWQALESIYGKSTLENARRLAFMIDRGNNAEAVDDLARTITESGLKSTESATRRVARMVPDNPCRHVGYIITLIRGETRPIITPATK